MKQNPANRARKGISCYHAAWDATWTRPLQLCLTGPSAVSALLVPHLPTNERKQSLPLGPVQAASWRGAETCWLPSKEPVWSTAKVPQAEDLDDSHVVAWETQMKALPC